MKKLKKLIKQKIKSAQNDLHNLQENNGDKNKINIIKGEIIAYYDILTEINYEKEN